MTDEGKCAVEIGIPPHYFHFTRCSRRAVERLTDEVGVCRQHRAVYDRRGWLPLAGRSDVIRRTDDGPRVQERWSKWT